MTWEKSGACRRGLLFGALLVLSCGCGNSERSGSNANGGSGNVAATTNPAGSTTQNGSGANGTSAGVGGASSGGASSDGTSSGGGSNQASTGVGGSGGSGMGGEASTSGGGGEASLCECYTNAYAELRDCQVQAPEPEPQPCTTAEDCCIGVPDRYQCNVDYPYIYDCRDGVCEAGSCTSDEQCAQGFEDIGAGYVSYTCQRQQALCSDEVRGYCVYERMGTECQTADDCCGSVPESYTCNQDWPYLYSCEAGQCASADCTSDEQCDARFATYSAGYTNLGCVTSEPSCDGTTSSTCQADRMPRPCDVADDCCPDPMPAGYTCNQDATYLYECIDGACEFARCTSDEQCDTYFEATYGSQEGYVNLGCQSPPVPKFPTTSTTTSTSTSTSTSTTGG
jgi:hypothetical protein